MKERDTMTDLERIQGIAKAIHQAAWAARLLTWMDGDGLKWVADASDCAETGPETTVETGLHTDQLNAWRELGARILPHLPEPHAAQLQRALQR